MKCILDEIFFLVGWKFDCAPVEYLRISKYFIAVFRNQFTSAQYIDCGT